MYTHININLNKFIYKDANINEDDISLNNVVNRFYNLFTYSARQVTNRKIKREGCGTRECVGILVCNNVQDR